MKTVLAILALLFAAPSWAASCYISEYAYVGKDKGGVGVQVALEPAVTTQILTFTVSAPSAAFNNLTQFVRIVCNAKTFFSFGAAPVATTSSSYIPADSAEYFSINTSGIKVAFYDGN